MKKFTLTLAMILATVASLAQLSMQQPKQLLPRMQMQPDITQLSAQQRSQVKSTVHTRQTRPHDIRSLQTGRSLRRAPQRHLGALPTLLPSGVETKTYSATCESGFGYWYGHYDVQIAFVDTKAYIGGLFAYMPDAFISGTLNPDGSITCEKDQYLGQMMLDDGEAYDIYVSPYHLDTETFADSFTFSYDAEADLYTLEGDDLNLIFCNEPSTTTAVDGIFNVVLDGNYVPEVVELMTEQPEGEMATYFRQGGAYYSVWGYLMAASQNGTIVRIVTAPDGETVYMENPISQCTFEQPVWIQGTRQGNKLHFPLGQYVAYFEDFGYGYKTALMTPIILHDDDYDEDYITYIPTEDTEVTYTIAADGTISMDAIAELDENENATLILGLVDSYDNYTWSQFGDYNSVYTPFHDEITTMPLGVEHERWAMLFNDGEYSNAIDVEVGIQGDKMYIIGISSWAPEAALVGTIQGNRVTFASDQFAGYGNSAVAYIAFGKWHLETRYDEDFGESYEEYIFDIMPTIDLSYDAARKVMTAQADEALIVNAGRASDEVLYMAMALAPKFSEKVDRAIKPATPIFNGMSNWFADYGYDIISVDIKLEDIEGKYIDKNLVKYIIWVKIDGHEEPFKFYNDEYVGLQELGLDEMVEIPYAMTLLDDSGYEDIAEAGSNVVLYETGFDDYGVQTVYYGGGERSVSDIAWMSETTGLQGITAQSSACQGIYDLSGRQLTTLSRGINIVRTADGRAVKVMVK